MVTLKSNYCTDSLNFGLDRIVGCYESSAREIQLLVISIQPPASISRIDLF